MIFTFDVANFFVIGATVPGLDAAFIAVTGWPVVHGIQVVGVGHARRVATHAATVCFGTLAKALAGSTNIAVTTQPTLDETAEDPDQCQPN